MQALYLAVERSHVDEQGAVRMLVLVRVRVYLRMEWVMGKRDRLFRLFWRRWRVIFTSFKQRWIPSLIRSQNITIIFIGNRWKIINLLLLKQGLTFQPLILLIYNFPYIPRRHLPNKRGHFFHISIRNHPFDFYLIFTQYLHLVCLYILLYDLSCIVVSVCFLLSVVDLLFVVLACLAVFLFWNLA